MEEEGGLPSSFPLAPTDIVLVSVSSFDNLGVGALVLPKDLKRLDVSFLRVGFFSGGFFSSGFGCVDGFVSGFGAGALMGFSGAFTGFVVVSGFLGSGL